MRQPQQQPSLQSRQQREGIMTARLELLGEVIAILAIWFVLPACLVIGMACLGEIQ